MSTMFRWLQTLYTRTYDEVNVKLSNATLNFFRSCLQVEIVRFEGKGVYHSWATVLILSVFRWLQTLHTRTYDVVNIGLSKAALSFFRSCLQVKVFKLVKGVHEIQAIALKLIQT
jgi:hypothetical protein